MYCIHFSGLLQAPGLPFQRISSAAPRNHTVSHMYSHKLSSPKRNWPKWKFSDPFPQSCLPHQLPHSQAKPSKEQPVVQSPRPHSPLGKLLPALSGLREKTGGISTRETTSRGLVTAGAAQERKLVSERRPCVSSWPQTLLCCVSVFMKCFSNKVSVPRRVRTLIKCRTCAVCQLAVEAYLNSFSDTIVLILIFSPCFFFFFSNSTCTFFYDV